ncbi:MAG TPA: arginine--tRNA ligase [Burkholderiales bacterium]|jgi:arginyl-tRNA synthetase|nr:arginine--tRNA ligase [Burkholderiales bacterium]
MLPAVKNDIIAALKAALRQTLGDAAPAEPNIVLERPKVAAHGDLACNIAMQLAKPLKKNPRELAQGIVAALDADTASKAVIESADIAGPGFINLRIPAAAKQRVVKEVLTQGEAFGRSNARAGQPLLVEFVSANPTGPLHVGHGRQGALGDSLCQLFESQGCTVTREFYYNDAGVQIATLATSVQARCKGLKPGDTQWPENAYNGDYIGDIAADFLAKKTVTAADMAVTASGEIEDIESIRKFAVAYLRNEQDIDLKVFGVRFDNYYLESSLYSDGKVEAAVGLLKAAGKTYEQDGALWLKSTDYGDDKDRVMKKSDGTYTYFVPDVAYHIAKWQRGFKRAINIQGSDHHGTIARVRAGLQAVNLGIPQGYPDYVLHKMVTVMKGGEEVKISKRAGSYVTLRDLIEMSGGGDLAKGRDAVRFFLISRKADTEFVFDVDLALKSTDENPVYYVQYAHARINSVLREWGGDRGTLGGADMSQLTHARELSALQKLAEFPDMLTDAATDLAPHDLTFYARDLAAEFHALYNERELRVLAAPDAVKMARLALYAATAQVIKNVLALLGVSAPEQM